MKFISKILIIMLIVFLIISNFSFSFAEDGGFSWDSIWNGIGAIIDGILGIILWPVRMIPVLIGGAIQMLAGSVASIGTKVGHGFAFVTMEDILFNKIPITELLKRRAKADKVVRCLHKYPMLY